MDFQPNNSVSFVPYIICGPNVKWADRKDLPGVAQQGRWVFDIETDDLLENLTKIHCAVAYNLDTDEIRTFGPDEIWLIPGFLLREVEELWGHNLISFDLPACAKVFGEREWRLCKEKFQQGQEGTVVQDSMVMARVIWPDIASMDWENLAKKENPVDEAMAKSLAGFTLSGKDAGKHSLRAWGHRLGYHKGNAEGEIDFQTYTPEMLEYCKRDVILNVKLIRVMEAKNPSVLSIWLEHQFYRYLEIMMKAGVAFDVEFANFLCKCWEKELDKRVQEMRRVIPDILKEDVFVPKVNRPGLGYEKGVPTTKRKVIPFNPRSADHIIGFLCSKYKWQPQEFTKNKSGKWPKGKPRVTYEILKALPYSEAPLLARIVLLMDRLGLVKNEKSAWLKCAKTQVDGGSRIYGRIIHNGTPTARCRHMAPNLGNIPSSKSIWGPTLRKLFIANKDALLVGTDFDSLEMACLAEVLYDFDGGAFYQMAFTGTKAAGTDPHSLNRKSIRQELEANGFHSVSSAYSRDNAKTNFYACLYGAWLRKLGMVASEGVGIPAAKWRFVGEAVKAGLAQNIEGLTQIVSLLEQQYDECLLQKKWPHLRLIDGRMVPIRKKSALLNSLLQAMGAILCKLACVYKLQALEQNGIILLEDWLPVLHVHDETQDELKVKDEDGQVTSKFTGLVAQCFRASGETFGFRIPITGTPSVGRNWAETH